VLVSRSSLTVIIALVVALMAGLVAGCGSGGSDVVATVGDVDLFEEDLTAQMESYAKTYGITEESDPEYWAQLKSDLLEGMIENEISLQKADELGVRITDEELQTQLDSMLTQWYNGDKSLLEEDLKAADLTMDEFEAQYKEYLIVQAVYEAVTGDVTVSDEAIAEYYEANLETYYVENSRTVRHILIAPGSDEAEDASTTTTLAGVTTTTVAGSATTTTTAWTDEQWAEALQKALEVRAKLVAGGDWTKLAAEYSDDTGTAQSGGDLGEVTAGEMVAEFEEAAFSLAPYEISQPVKSSYGYHIIQVMGVTEAYTKPLEEVKASISETLLGEAQYDAWEAWLAAAREEIGVVYGKSMQPTTTVPAAGTTTTVGDTITTADPTATTTP
jgi:parvulin-like peptidyl-prolyl isomerase